MTLVPGALALSSCSLFPLFAVSSLDAIVMEEKMQASGRECEKDGRLSGSSQSHMSCRQERTRARQMRFGPEELQNKIHFRKTLAQNVVVDPSS